MESILKRAIKNPKKALDRLQNIFLYKFTEKSRFPGIIYLSINNICNHRCIMCDFGQKTDSGFYRNLKGNEMELSLDVLKRVIDDVKGFKPVISIKAVEPLLYKRIIDLVAYIKKSGLKCGITTNGLLLENFAKDFVKLDLDYLHVSIDGPPKINDYIRGVNGAFDKAYKGLKLIKKYKKKYNKGPYVTVNSAISNLNYRYLTEIFFKLKNLDINEFSFKHLEFVTKDMKEKHNIVYSDLCRATESTISKYIQPKKINIKELYEQIKGLKKYKNYNILFTPELSLKDLEIYYRQPDKFLKGYDKCYLPWMTSSINASGDVTVHIRCYHKILGNINKERFADIWNNKEYRNLRRVLKKIKAFPACSRCCGVLGRNKLIR